MGKLHLLHTYVNGIVVTSTILRQVRKRLTMSMKANHMIFLKVQ